MEKHNMFCPLDLPTKRKHRVFISMIKGLREGPLCYAITANPNIYMSWIKEFWTNAKVSKDETFLDSSVAGKRLTISVVDIRQALQIKDADDHSFKKFNKNDLESFVKQIGYDDTWKSFEKKHLPPFWKLLFHIVVHCLSDQKGGFGGLRIDWVGVMSVLTNGEQFNFSHLIFVCMLANVNSSTRWMLYPRFVQLLLDDLMTNVPKPNEERVNKKMVRQIVFQALLNDSQRDYKYQGKLPENKFGKFEETEQLGDESDEETESEDEETDTESIVAQEMKKRKAISKPSVGGTSKENSVVSIADASELELPLKRSKRVGDSKKAPSLRFKLATVATSSTTPTPPPATQTDPYTASPETMSRHIAIMKSKQIKVPRLKTKTKTNRQTLHDSPITSPEVCPTTKDTSTHTSFIPNLDEPNLDQPSSPSSLHLSFTSPLRTSTIWTSTFIPSPTTEPINLEIPSTTITQTYPITLTFPLTFTPQPFTQSITLPLQSSTMPIVSQTSPSVTRSPFITPTPLTSGKFVRPPRYTDPILDRIMALEESNKKRAERERIVMEYVKAQKVKEQESEVEKARLVERVDALIRAREEDKTKIDIYESMIASLQSKSESNQKLMSEAALSRSDDHDLITQQGVRIAHLETNLPTFANIETRLRREFNAEIDHLRSKNEQLEAKLQFVENDKGIDNELRLEVVELKKRLIEHQEDHDSLFMKFKTTVDFIDKMKKDLRNLKNRIRAIFNTWEDSSDSDTTGDLGAGGTSGGGQGKDGVGGTSGGGQGKDGADGTSGGGQGKDGAGGSSVEGSGTELIVTGVTTSSAGTTDVTGSKNIGVGTSQTPTANDDDDSDDDSDDDESDDDDGDEGNDEPHDRFDDDNDAGDGGSGTGNKDQTGVSAPQNTTQDDPTNADSAKEIRDRDASLEDDFASIFNVVTCAGTSSMQVTSTTNIEVSSVLSMPADGAIQRKKRVWHCVNAEYSTRCRNDAFHDESLLIFVQWHDDSECWALRRENGDMTYQHLSKMHNLRHLDMNFFTRIAGDGVGEKGLQGFFRRHMRRQAKTGFSNFKLNMGKKIRHPTLIDEITKRKKKMVRFAMPSERPCIFLGGPIELGILKNFQGWHLDDQTGEAVIQYKEAESFKSFRFFDEHSLIRFEKEDLLKLFESPCQLLSFHDRGQASLEPLVETFNSFVRRAVETPLENGCLEYETD